MVKSLDYKFGNGKYAQCVEAFGDKNIRKFSEVAPKFPFSRDSFEPLRTHSIHFNKKIRMFRYRYLILLRSDFFTHNQSRTCNYIYTH